MAKKAKARRKGRATKTDAQQIEMKFPADAKLKRLMSAVDAADADKNESVGRKGSLISQAVERDHLDKKAWADLCSYKRMSPIKARYRYRHFLHYLKVFGLEEAWDEQAEMFEQPKAAAPKPDSFAEKVRQGADAVREQTRTTTLTNPKQTPSPAEIKRVADRAEAVTETTH